MEYVPPDLLGVAAAHEASNKVPPVLRHAEPK
jgi:hypothetical protein